MITTSSSEEIEPMRFTVRELLAAIVLFTDGEKHPDDPKPTHKVFDDTALWRQTECLLGALGIDLDYGKTAFAEEIINFLALRVFRFQLGIPSSKFIFSPRNAATLRSFLYNALRNARRKEWLLNAVARSPKTSF